MKFNLLLTSLLLGSSINALASDAAILKVEESVVINAPASKVWDKAGNFGDLGAWHPAVKNTEIVAGSNNTKGAERLLTLQDNGTIKEKLLDYSAKNMTYRYSILEGVLPVSHYASTLSIKPQGDKTLVVWKGAFKRKDTSDKPAAGQGDEDAVKTITSVYRGGLDNLKKIAE